MKQIIITLVIIGIIALAIVIAVSVIRHKLEKATRKYLNMNLDQVGNAIRDGLRDESEPPRSISVMTSIHKPKLQADFPETSYEQLESMARNALTGFLAAVETEQTDKLFKPSTNLTRQTEDRISNNRLSQKTPERFTDIKIHKTSLANYINSNGTADAVFEIAFECYHYFNESEKRSAPNQLACSVILNCGRAVADETKTAVFAHNCPNCGAPITAIGKNKVCEYCGSGISELGIKVWLADSVKFI